MNEKIVFAINKINPSAAASLVKLREQGELIHVLVLRDTHLEVQDRSRPVFAELPITELETDFFDSEKLRRDVEPFRETVIGVVSRGESSIQYLARLSDACRDWGLALPTSTSLEIATDKRRMRQAFAEHCPEVTPKYIRVQDDSDASIRAIEEEVGYPAIVKPANLASSLLIQRCDTFEQLREALAKAFGVIRSIYKESDRHEEPVIIVEQMLEGELYSVDTYISQDGVMQHCPPVAYVTGQSIGVDDFFLYKRNLPVYMDAACWSDCQGTVERGIQAIGLRATTAHVELCKTKDGWKIIEIGPRVGRYRIEMYHEAYGIGHSDNDIKVRLGMETEVSGEVKASCSVYSIYPAEEGELVRISQIDEVRQLRSLKYIRSLAENGTQVRHAKNGGHALVEVILAHDDSEQFERDCAWLEANVRAVVEATNWQEKATSGEY